MYYDLIQQYVRSLGNLERIVDKAIAHAEKKKFDPNNFMTQRLAPDMFTFCKQIQVACDVAKSAAANFSGKEAPKFEDNETKITEIKTRIQKTLNYLRSFSPADFKNVNGQDKVKIPFPPNKLMHMQDYLWSRSIPNFFFHYGMAYALLRQGGVEIGKGDFLGELNLFDS